MRAGQRSLGEETVFRRDMAAGKTMKKRFLQDIQMTAVRADIDKIEMGAVAVGAVADPVDEFAVLDKFPFLQVLQPGDGYLRIAY